MLYIVWKLLWKWQKLDANFSSAAMPHTFSRLRARDISYKNFFSVCLILFCQELQMWPKKLSSAKVVKHCKNMKKCCLSIWCTGTINKLVNFVFPNSTRLKENWVTLELWLSGKGLVSFQLESDCIYWCLLMVCLPAKILLSQILHNTINKHPDSSFSNVSPDARPIVASWDCLSNFKFHLGFKKSVENGICKKGIPELKHYVLKRQCKWSIENCNDPLKSHSYSDH